MPKTAILYIAERCNLSCVFCLEEDGAWKDFTSPPTDEVFKILGRLSQRGARHITFMGGETFFRKDLERIVARAKTLGFTRVGVTTNGTVLSKKGFIEKLIEAGLDFIELSIHAHTKELARAISRTSFTFDRQAAALAEIDAAGGLFTIVNVVVCHENKSHLKEIARYVCDALPNTPLRLKFKFVSLLGLAAEESAHGAALPYGQVDFVSLGDALQARGVPFWFYNVPLCRLGVHARHAHELSTLSVDETYFDFDHFGPDGYYESGHQLEGRVWPEAACGTCPVRPVCPGLEETYRLAHGAQELSRLNADPETLVAFALGDRDNDPARAAERVEALRRAPRPSTFARSRPDGAVRYVHAQEGEPIDLVVEPRLPGTRAFRKTPRFTLSYRRWSDEDPVLRPRVSALLVLALEALKNADAAGLALAEARARLATLQAGGWTIASRPALPEPHIEEPPSGEAPQILRSGRGCSG